MSYHNTPHDPNAVYIPARPDGHPSVRGRPKGAVNARPIVLRIAFEKHKVKENGKTVKRTTLELIILILQREAMAGNHRAAAIRDRYFGNYLEPDMSENKADGVLVVAGDLSAEEWIKNQERENARIDALMQEVQNEMRTK